MKVQRVYELKKPGKVKSRIPSALQRFNWEHRVIRDTAGHELGCGIPLDDDTRTPRNPLCGKETTGFLVQHRDLNRKRRRELSRGSRFPLRGSNRPRVGKLNVEDVFSG
jgi:hypothetical protein